ncbi:hypothetical protein [Aquincola tertiaricarbonis]|uniref:hypothetical protein n=1 Tax=Aquincola tertiaricarbonis TaxID=391953 RepID=UPI0012EE3D33|nr:hypothetical protein [Aquincola tertiaricarbonis]
MQAFFQALESNPEWYLLALLLSAGGVILLIRSSITTLYDPWAVQQVNTIFASAAVILLWMAGAISSSLMIYHVAAVCGFLGCAGLVFRYTTHTYCAARQVRPRALTSLRNVCLLLFVTSQLGAWAVGGLPILLESRLNAFSSGGGIGVLSRIISFTSFAAVFLTVLRIGISKRKRVNFTDSFVFVFTVIASIASASKGNIVQTLLLVLTSHWIFKHLIRNYAAPQVSKKMLVTFGASLALLMLVPLAVELARGPETAVGGPLEAFIIRLVLSGDVYMWMYGDDYISSITVGSPTALLFSDFLGVTRLASWNELPVHPGLQVFQMLFPDRDEIRGPNMRVDVFGLLYGSMAFGVFFSALLGAVFGLLRGWLFRVRNPLLFLPAAYLFFQAPAFFADPLLGVTALVNTGFGVVIVVVAVALVGRPPVAAGSRVRLSRLKAAMRSVPPLNSA